MEHPLSDAERANRAEQANERLAAELRRYAQQIDELRTEAAAQRTALDPGRLGAALETVNRLAGFVYRRTEQESRSSGDGIGVLLRATAYAHGAADAALSAGRPDIAAKHVAYLVGQAERWREHPDFASLNISIASIPDGAIDGRRFAPGDVQVTSIQLAPHDDGDRPTTGRD